MPKILLADKNVFMRRTLSCVLKECGFEDIIEVDNGMQAIVKFDSERPDLVLLNAIIPEVEAIEVAKNIIPMGAKVLMVSVAGRDESMERAKGVGVQGYLIKPFEVQDIVDEVKRITSDENRP